MTSTQGPPAGIVVGYAHTASGSAALRTAVREAQRAGTDVEVVHVFDVRRRADAAMAGDLERVRRDAVRRAQQRVRAVVAEVGAETVDGDLTEPGVTFRSADGTLEEALAAAARGRARLVLGEPGADEDRALPSRLSRRCGIPVTLVSE
ncbi:MAG: hypothetical protein ACXVEV_00290, partial [Nocardioidaceae bacterium]